MYIEQEALLFTKKYSDDGNLRPNCELSPVQRNILQTLLYFDIFGHPLRISEIHQFLPSDSTSFDDIRTACLTAPLAGQISHRNGLYYLKGRSEMIVEERSRKERRAFRMWKIAVLVAHIIGQFPFVRGVFVSGELSKGVASKRSDIDFFVVTAKDRVWIVRTLFTVFKKIFLLGRRKFFCYNHIASEQHLSIEEKNVYTATELVTLRPIVNETMVQRLLGENLWVSGFLPNAAAPAPLISPAKNREPIVERIVNSLVTSTRLDSIDGMLLNKWKQIWKKRYSEISDAKRQELFQCGPQISTAYTRDFLAKVMQEYRLRLRQYDLA